MLHLFRSKVLLVDVVAHDAVWPTAALVDQTVALAAYKVQLLIVQHHIPLELAAQLFGKLVRTEMGQPVYVIRCVRGFVSGR
uniref:Putative secreted protein n=1 Tax=Anopheles darlingi TaxID=43151 RepID=A0A2M4D7B7_ANODA